MDPRVVDFVQNVAQDIAGLEVALYFQDNPKTFDTAGGLALLTRRKLDEVTSALLRLTAAGILESSPRDDGHYVCYSLREDPNIWNLLCLLSEAYLDSPEDRQAIIRLLVGRHRHPHPPQSENGR
ncbi:MAG: hypothetical protein ACYC63_17385 [Armatimonadota bacterium]